MNPLGAVNTELSRRAARLVGAEKKQCWKNALLALAGVAELESAQYVEGWVITDIPIPIEHGWLELPGGVVVDPTLPLVQDDAALTVNRYYAGARYGRREALERGQRETLPLVYHGNGWGGNNHPGYRAAGEAALRDAFGA